MQRRIFKKEQNILFLTVSICISYFLWKSDNEKEQYHAAKRLKGWYICLTGKEFVGRANKLCCIISIRISYFLLKNWQLQYAAKILKVQYISFSTVSIISYFSLKIWQKRNSTGTVRYAAEIVKGTIRFVLDNCAFYFVLSFKIWE
jgi:hypothetical protein